MATPKKPTKSVEAPTLFAVDSDVPTFRSRRVEAGGADARSAQEPDLFSMAAFLPSSGYEAWQMERQKAKRTFESQWRVPLGCRVRVQLSSQGRPVEGVIRVIEDAGDDASPEERFLRLGDIAFSPREVESLVRL